MCLIDDRSFLAMSGANSMNCSIAGTVIMKFIFSSTITSQIFTGSNAGTKKVVQPAWTLPKIGDSPPM